MEMVNIRERENNTLYKATGSIHISNTLNVLERKTWNILLSFSYKSLLDNNTHEVSVNEIMKILGWDSDNNHDDLKGVCKKLVETSVVWNILGKDRKNSWTATTLLSFAHIENGICKYRFDESIVGLLFQPNIYAKLDMDIQKKIKNKYALVLWEIFVEDLSVEGKQESSFTLPIVVLRALLGLKDNEYYQEFKYFNKEILKPAILEINEISDIEVLYEPVKRCRKTIAMKFVFKFKSKLEITPESLKNFEKILNAATVTQKKTSKKAVSMLELNPIVEIKDSIKEKMSKYGFSEAEMVGLVEKSGKEDIEQSLDAAIEYIYNNSSDIKSAKAVIKKAVKEGWGISDKQIVNVQKAKIEKEEQEARLVEFLRKANEFQVFIINHCKDKDSAMSLASSKFEVREFGDSVNLLEIQSLHHSYRAVLRDFFVESKEAFKNEFPHISSIRIDAMHHIDLQEENI